MYTETVLEAVWLRKTKKKPQHFLYIFKIFNCKKLSEGKINIRNKGWSLFLYFLLFLQRPDEPVTQETTCLNTQKWQMEDQN